MYANIMPGFFIYNIYELSKRFNADELLKDKYNCTAEELDIEGIVPMEDVVIEVLYHQPDLYTFDYDEDADAFRIRKLIIINQSRKES